MVDWSWRNGFTHLFFCNSSVLEHYTSTSCGYSLCSIDRANNKRNRFAHSNQPAQSRWGLASWLGCNLIGALHFPLCCQLVTRPAKVEAAHRALKRQALWWESQVKQVCHMGSSIVSMKECKTCRGSFKAGWFWVSQATLPQEGLLNVNKC